MKIRIELDDSLTEEEVIIRCNSISEKVQKMQMALSEIENAQEKMVLYKKETEYYVKLDDILFFEAVPDQLQTDRQPFCISSARNAHARKSCQINRNRINITEIHFQRIT